MTTPVTFRTTFGPVAGSPWRQPESVVITVLDEQQTFSIAENIADEAARDWSGKVTVLASIILPARGGLDYGTDKFTVELRRGR